MTERPSSLGRLAVLFLALAAAAAGAQVPGPAPQVLQRGDVVPPFDAESLQGSIEKVAYAKGDTLLLFFLSSCPSCHRMIPEWNRAYERRPKGLRVYGVLLDKEPPGFFMAVPVSFPVLRAPSGGEFRQSYKLAKVPLTLRVGPGGQVLEAGMGQIDAMRLGELFRP
jgi:hypothetical protein